MPIYPHRPFRLDKGDLPHLQRLQMTGSMSDVCRLLVRSRDIKECICIIVSVTHDLETEVAQLLLPSHPVAAPVVLHRLEILHLGMPIDAPGSELLWDRICLPSLKSFHVNIHQRPVWNSLYACLERSRPPLEHFVALLYCITTDARQLVEMLSWMPTLKALYLTLECINEAVIEAFWRAFRGEHHLINSREFRDVPGGEDLSDLSGIALPICPRLEELFISTYCPNSLLELAETVLSRCPSSASDAAGMLIPSEANEATDTSDRYSLQKLGVNRCDFTKEEFLNYPGIDRCVQAGLSVHLLLDYFHVQRQ